MRGKLRKVKLKSGRYSLYIDYYPAVWNPHTKRYTRREYLKLYLYQHPQSVMERQENALANEIAQTVYLKRMKALMLDVEGVFNKDILQGDFYGYFADFIRRKQKGAIETALYHSALQHLKAWRPENLRFKDIDELFLEGFKNYLYSATFLKSEQLKLKPNSQASYYDKVAAVVSRAFVERYLFEDYTLRVDRIPNELSFAERLQIDDIAVLQETPCADDLVYRSSIFAYLTGFRYSAIETLKWEHLHYSEALDSWYINFLDPKPDRPFKHFICKEAIEVLGERKEESDPLFPGITYYRVRKGLKEWFAKVGLENKARFHNWRRRYASSLNYNDVELYVIKEMLNHKHVATTELYVDVDEMKKVQAAQKMTISKE